jgi:hypothetical protein
MFTEFAAIFIASCFEGFFYGKTSVLCALTCIFAKEVQLLPGLGLYSGIFAVYLQLERPPNKSRAATILLYALCLLYVLSTVNVAVDLVSYILGEEVSNNSICKNIIFLYQFCRRIFQIHCNLIF